MLESGEKQLLFEFQGFTDKSHNFLINVQFWT